MEPWVIFLIIVLAILTVGPIKNLIMQRRFIKDLASSPECNALLNYAKEKKIKMTPSLFYFPDDEYHWSVNMKMPKIITISINSKGKIVPSDYFLRKIIFAHEIYHTEQEELYLFLKYNCKTYKNGRGCIYLEIDAWNRAFELLSKLKLFQNDSEIRKFWAYVDAKPKQGQFWHCKMKSRDGNCPKTSELRTKIFR